MFRRSRPSMSELPLEEAIFDGAYMEGDVEHVSLPTSRAAFFLVIGVAICVIGIAVGRAGFLSFVRGEFYVNRANANVTREVALPVHRAEIVDRYGATLATSANSFSVFLNISSFI